MDLGRRPAAELPEPLARAVADPRSYADFVGGPKYLPIQYRMRA